MAEPLAVDPARLSAVGSQLAGLVFPTPPPPLAAPGADPVSAAINETMPAIESLVSDGLPGVKAALTRTASSMANAASIYTKADQSLGDALTQVQFAAGNQKVGARAAAGGTGQSTAQLLSAPTGVAAPLGQAAATQISELTPRVAATVPQLVQLAPQAGQMAQQVSPIAQTIGQTAQQAASPSSSGGPTAMPAQLAGDTASDGPPQHARLVDETKPDDQDQAPSEGEAAGAATAGEGTLGSAPADGAADGSPPSGPTTVPI